MEQVFLFVCFFFRQQQQQFKRVWDDLLKSRNVEYVCEPGPVYVQKLREGEMGAEKHSSWSGCKSRRCEFNRSKHSALLCPALCATFTTSLLTFGPTKPCWFVTAVTKTLIKVAAVKKHQKSFDQFWVHGENRALLCCTDYFEECDLSHNTLVRERNIYIKHKTTTFFWPCALNIVVSFSKVFYI